MNLIITSCHLVKMTKAIILFYRPVPFPGVFPGGAEKGVPSLGSYIL